jgi:glycerophosphoryl diester phosphodiesterase
MSTPPIVIAHRGASGYLPEHTLEAKALAYGYGADFLEQDVIATRDGALVVLHDLVLDNVTDVAQQYQGRQRADGRFYVIDFALDELRQLRVFERRRDASNAPQFPGRFPVGAGRFRIATLAEEIEMIRGINRATGRDVGLYPEIKDPRWHREHGVDLAPLVLDTLAAYGYTRATDNVFVQCFDPDELRRIRSQLGSELKLVQLAERGASYGDVTSAAGVRNVAAYAQGLGPAYAQLVNVERGVPRANDLTKAAKDAGLLLHPYTFRRDQLPEYAASLDELLMFFFSEIGVNGVFCDHPDIAARCAAEWRKGRFPKIDSSGKVT